MKFKHPILYGKLIEKRDKKWIYEPSSYDFIIAPYDGVIDEVTNGVVDNCNGFLKIKHIIDGDEYYSEICNFKDASIHRGVNIKQGDKIAQTSSENVKYEIKNKGKEKIVIIPFFDGSMESAGHKKEVNSKENNKSSGSGDDYDSGYKPKYKEKIDKVPDVFTSLFLSPINLIHKALTDFPGKKKEEKEQEELNEEIKRMKQLLK
jgi:hypothetical protein